MLTVVVGDIYSVPSFPINVTVAPDLNAEPVITKSNPAAICVSVIFVLLTLETEGGVSIGTHDVQL